MNLMVEWFVINALTVYKMELFTVLTDFIKSKCFFQTNYITPSDYECIILLEKGGLMREIYLPCSTYRNIDILIAYLLIERRKNKKTTSRYKHDITWLQIAIFPDGAKNDGVFRLFSDFTCDFCINRLKNTSFITSNPANLTVWHDVYILHNRLRHWKRLKDSISFSLHHFKSLHRFVHKTNSLDFRCPYFHWSSTKYRFLSSAKGSIYP